MEKKKRVKIILGLFYFSSLICIIVLGFLFFKDNFSTLSQKVESANKLSKKEFNSETCKGIFELKDKEKILKHKDFNFGDYSNLKYRCNSLIVKINKISLDDEFNKFYDFKSGIKIETNENLFEYNKSQKEEVIKKILDKIKVEPEINKTQMNYVTKNNNIVFYLPFEPSTKYSVSLKLENDILGDYIGFDNIKKEFTTKENKALGLFMNEKPRLYKDKKLPTFNIVSHNIDRKSAEIKLCRVSNENFVKIDVFKQYKQTDKVRDFYINGIDKINTFKCYNKTIKLDSSNKNFEIGDLIGNPGRSGLYYITFVDKELRKGVNNIAVKPMTFGVIDSQIIYKRYEDKAFFYVSDFNGNPIKGMKIRGYSTDFDYEEKKRGENRKYYFETTGDLNKNYLGDSVVLGETGKDGVLEADLGELKKVQDSRNLFFTATNLDHITYVKSSWSDSVSKRDFKLKSGHSSGYVGHVFTDRKIYKTGETVHIKGIVRDSKNLSTSKGKEVKLFIENPKWDSYKEAVLRLSEYGSFDYSFKIEEGDKMGKYHIRVFKKGDEDRWYGNIARSNFNVEVFKNPKFKTDITINTQGIKDGVLNGDKTSDDYKKFTIKAKVNSEYYSGGLVKNAKVKYNLYRQEYFDYSYRDDCFWGCYWEGHKVLYTSGDSLIDENGISEFDIKVNARNTSMKMKYILEAEVTDNSGDVIAGSNSIIVSPPAGEGNPYGRNYKLITKTDNKLYKNSKDILLEVGILGDEKWQKNYSGKLGLAIMKKIYSPHKYISYKSIEQTNLGVSDEFVSYLTLNEKDFIKKNGKTYLKIKLKDSGDYNVYFGVLNKNSLGKNKDLKDLGIKEDMSHNTNIYREKFFSVSYAFSNFGKADFTIYSKGNSSIPYIDDLKLQVIEDKIVHKVGEKGKMLVRLPAKKGKLLITKERKGVIEHKVVSTNSNNYLYEYSVTEDLKPNVYIGFAFMSEDGDYDSLVRIGYGEIVVDKTSFKADILLKTNKEKYKPREEVEIAINVKDKKGKGLKSEVTLMVVDDSLISLLGNVDLNVLEKIYKKVSLEISNALTTHAMKYRYFFGRYGAEGGSGESSNKGDDGASFSRTIFKNTAYFNPSIITDENGNAKVKFKLPDNLTNFRIMAISNSKENLFGNKEKIINVRKEISILDKTPFIFRNGDTINIGANIVNLSDKKEKLKIVLEINDEKLEKSIELEAGKREFVGFKVDSKGEGNIQYKFKAIGKNKKLLDEMVGNIEMAISPNLMYFEKKNLYINQNGKSGEGSFVMNENYNLENKLSEIEISISKGGLGGIGEIAKELMKYPYGCAEQTTSSTLPNAVMLELNKKYKFLSDEEVKKAKENIKIGIERIKKLQRPSGGFAFWISDNEVNNHVTPYVTFGLLKMKDYGVEIPKDLLNNALSYITKNLDSFDNNVKADALYTLSLSEKTDYKKTSTINKLLSDKNLNGVSRIKLAMALTNFDKNKYKDSIQKIINEEKIALSLGNRFNYSYWNEITTKALLVQAMINFEDNDNEYIFKTVQELYKKDFRSYYYSTQTKIMGFIAFVDYSKYLGSDEDSEIIVNGQKIILGKDKIVETIKIPLSKYKGKEIANFKAKIISGKRAMVTLKLKAVPFDVTKLPNISNDLMKIKKDIYEIVKTKDGKYSTKLKLNNAFEKGKEYLVDIKVDIKENIKNFTIEDYLPSGFTVLNTNFKTVSNKYDEIVGENYWWGDRKEIKKDRIMSYRKWADGVEHLKYIVRADFEGDFTLPGATAYNMYRPSEVVSSEFERVTIK